MRRRHISEVERELGVHERELPVEELNRIAGQREHRPPPPEPMAPREWRLTEFVLHGYLLCRGCKRPTSIAPGTDRTCVHCGADRVEFVRPEPAFDPNNQRKMYV